MVSYEVDNSSSSFEDSPRSPPPQPPSRQRQPDRIRTPTPLNSPVRNSRFTPPLVPARPAGVHMPGAWLRSSTPDSMFFANGQETEYTASAAATEIIPQPLRSPRSPPDELWGILPAPTPKILRRVRDRVVKNRSTQRDLRRVRRLRNQPTILRLLTWTPLDPPDVPEKETWAEYLSSWGSFVSQPFSYDPEARWTKELTFETVNDGNLSDWLDALEGSEFSGLEEGKIWHTLMSLLHAALWLHRGRTFRDRNWYLSDSLPTDQIPFWKPVLHGKIDPEHILYNQTFDPKRPYGDCKLFVPTDSKLLPSFHGKLTTKNLPSSTTYYSAPELTWMKPSREDEAPMGAKSDLWSIGAVCVEMMGGPFYVDQPQSWYDVPSAQQFADLSFNMYEEKNMARWQACDLPKEYSRTLRAAVANMLVFRPGDRPDIEECITFARTQFIAWRKRVRSSRPRSARQGIIWITPSLFRNRAPKRDRTNPEGIDRNPVDPFWEARRTLARAILAFPAAVRPWQ